MFAHIYLTSTGHTWTGNIKAMVTGWEELDLEEESAQAASRRLLNRVRDELSIMQDEGPTVAKAAVGIGHVSIKRHSPAPHSSGAVCSDAVNGPSEAGGVDDECVGSSPRREGVNLVANSQRDLLSDGRCTIRPKEPAIDKQPDTDSQHQHENKRVTS